jgi:hypothetical protein
MCFSFCAACGDRLVWERRVGEVMERWIGSCDCGWVRVLHVQAVAEERDS